MNLTMEEAVRVGMELRKVVQTDSFETAVNTLNEQYRSEVFNSTPTEVSRRERAYAQSNALTELLITMNTFISLAEADALEAEDLPDEDQLTLFE